MALGKQPVTYLLCVALKAASHYRLKAGSQYACRDLRRVTFLRCVALRCVEHVHNIFCARTCYTHGCHDGERR